MSVVKEFGEDEIVSITCADCRDPKLTLLQVNYRLIIRYLSCGFISDFTDSLKQFDDMRKENESRQVFE